MPRLIDADMLEPSEVYMNYGFTRIVYMDDIDELPTVDAVEVVRCKDCKYRDHRTCTWNKAPVLNPFDFCSRGVKKDEE